MSTPSSVLEAQLQSLLQLVEQQRAEECAQVEAEVRQQRDEILQRAHHQARTRMHEAIVTERRRNERQLDSTRAQLRTRNREHQHKVALLMLHRGWEALREALAARWRDPQTQKQWCDNLLERAQARLPGGPWDIEHPSGWKQAPAQAFAQQVRQATGYAPTLCADSDISAGLRICADTACLDATLGRPGIGLLADRTTVEARLLAHLHHILAKREGNHGNGQ